jgi:sugar lactone lactonase YvrE
MNSASQLSRASATLAFLSVMLSDEEALTPAEECYHRLVSSFALIVAAVFWTWLSWCAKCNPVKCVAQLGAKVEKLAKTPKPDGMLKGRASTVYLAAFKKNAIMCFDSRSAGRSQSPKTIACNGRTPWRGDRTSKLYVTTSQIHRMPKYHGGQSKQQGAFMVYRVKVP